MKQSVLTKTGSVKIKHNADKFSNMGLSFSTCHIYKILTVKQWGGNPNFSREFSEPSKPTFFNYWDYHIAWFTAFLIQNKDFHHSWMLYMVNKWMVINPKNFKAYTWFFTLHKKMKLKLWYKQVDIRIITVEF